MAAEAGRPALVAYLRTEVAAYLAGRFPSEEVRRAMTSAAGELAYLAGWTAFDAGEHPVAVAWFTVATKLAEEARDAPLAGHVLRAMAHQAVDLHHPRRALELAEGSMIERRYKLAAPANAHSWAWCMPELWPSAVRRRRLWPR